MGTIYNPPFTVEDAIARGHDVFEVIFTNWGISANNPPRTLTDFTNLQYPQPGQPGLPATLAGIAIGPKSTVDRAWVTFNLGKRANLAEPVNGYQLIREVSVEAPLLFTQASNPNQRNNPLDPDDPVKTLTEKGALYVFPFVDRPNQFISIVAAPAGATHVGTTATFTTTAPHGLFVGATAVIQNVAIADYNGTWTVTNIISPTSFEVVLATTPSGNSGGGRLVVGGSAVQIIERGSAGALTPRNDSTVLPKQYKDANGVVRNFSNPILPAPVDPVFIGPTLHLVCYLKNPYHNPSGRRAPLQYRGYGNIPDNNLDPTPSERLLVSLPTYGRRRISIEMHTAVGPANFRVGGIISMGQLEQIQEVTLASQTGVAANTPVILTTEVQADYINIYVAAPTDAIVPVYYAVAAHD